MPFLEANVIKCNEALRLVLCVLYVAAEIARRDK